MPMDLRQAVVLLVQVSVFLTVVGFGLRATRDDVLYLFRRPALLARSLAAMFVLVPVGAVAMGALLQLHPAIEVALIVLGVSPMPPLLPRRQLQGGGRLSYGIGLAVTAGAASIVVVPLALLVIGRVLGQSMAMPPGALARLVLLSVILPLATGMLLQRLAPSVAARVAKPLAATAIIGLVVATVLLLLAILPSAVSLIGNGTLLAIAAFVAAGLGVGHALGGPSRDERVVLALSTACRHPAIAIAIAAVNYPKENLVPAAIVLYLLVNVAITIPYIAWQKRKAAGAPA